MEDYIAEEGGHRGVKVRGIDCRKPSGAAFRLSHRLTLAECLAAVGEVDVLRVVVAPGEAMSSHKNTPAAHRWYAAPGDNKP